MRFDSSQLEVPLPTLSQWESLTLTGGRRLERARRWLSKRYRQLTLHDFSSLVSQTEFEHELAYYSELISEGNEASFFSAPEQVPRVLESTPFILSHGEIVDFSFESTYQSRITRIASDLESHPHKRKVHIRLWKHPPGMSKGQIIAIHGFDMSDPRVLAVTLLPGFFYRLGLDVAVFEMPNHGKRKGDASFPSLDIVQTNETIAQTIWELRQLRSYLMGRSEVPVGVLGLSFGAYIASLWASLDSLGFVLSVAPIVDMGDLGRNLFKRLPRKERKAFELLDFHLYQRVFSLHSPLKYRIKTPVHRRMILASLLDPLVPSEHALRLWRHWNQPKLCWLFGGHLDQLARKRALQEVHRFLLDSDLALEDLLVFD